MEAGHISENVYLQATDMDLGTVAVGAFSDEEVGDLLQLDDHHSPLYVMPLGRIRN
jgi:nitroreductase